MPGWFTYDDCAHFTLVLNTQRAAGVRGDVLEIGSYHGRSTIVLADCLSRMRRWSCATPSSRVMCTSATPRPPKTFARTSQRALPHFDLDRLEIHEAYSKDLVLPDEQRFRFVHVDGSHEEDDVILDLRLARRHLAPGGVIVVDDYDHPDWPGVTAAVHTFLAEAPETGTVADLNRHSESGRKLYLALPG